MINEWKCLCHFALHHLIEWSRVSSKTVDECEKLNIFLFRRTILSAVQQWFITKVHFLRMSVLKAISI